LDARRNVTPHREQQYNETQSNFLWSAKTQYRTKNAQKTVAATYSITMINESNKRKTQRRLQRTFVCVKVKYYSHFFNCCNVLLMSTSNSSSRSNSSGYTRTPFFFPFRLWYKKVVVRRAWFDISLTEFLRCTHNTSGWSCDFRKKINKKLIKNPFRMVHSP